MAADIGETTDVGTQHPDVVQRLQDYVQQMDGDLGADRPRANRVHLKVRRRDG